jgi:hypothetical protein
MTQINRDLYAGGHLFALVNRVTCLFDRETDVTAAVRALEEEGVATEDIDLFVGEQGADSLDLPGRGHGPVVRLLRTLEDATGDMSETTHRIDDAIRRGATLLSVKLHKRPLFRQDADGRLDVVLFERQNEEKARALRVLKALHAREIHYWGPWSVEDVPSS